MFDKKFDVVPEDFDLEWEIERALERLVEEGKVYVDETSGLYHAVNGMTFRTLTL